MTNDESRVAADAYTVALQDKAGFVPLDDFLPAAESLRGKGWLERRMVDGEPVYTLTATARTAMELQALGDPGYVSLN